MSRLLFQGRKTFWLTKSSLELAIFEFRDYDIYEIIAYDPVLQKHTPRLYVNICTVNSILECCNIYRREIGNTLIVDDDEAIITYLFNHIIITEYLPTSKIIKINIRTIFLEEKCGDDISLAVRRPMNLPFIPSPFMNSVEKQENYLKIPLRDKWRLPLIIVRVAKGLSLRKSDAITWALFTKDKTQQVLVDSLTTTLSMRISSEHKDVMRSIVRSALLPVNCPFPRSPSHSIVSTPRSYDTRLMRSDSTTPRAGSPLSSAIPSCTNTPRLNVPIPIATPSTPTVDVVDTNSTHYDSTTTDMLSTGTSTPTMKLDLSHLTLRIPAASSPKQQSVEPKSLRSPSWFAPSTLHSTTTTCSTPSIGSSVNSPVARTMWDGGVLSRISKSLPTSPHYTSNRVLPCSTEDILEGLKGEEVVGQGINKMKKLYSYNGCLSGTLSMLLPTNRPTVKGLNVSTI